MTIIDKILATKKLEDLQIEKTPVISSIPEITNYKVEEAIILLKEIEKNNGYISIADKVGLTQEQVKDIHEKINKRIIELSQKGE